MDGNHAIGGSLIGLAFTALFVRVFWMSSPPFNAMAPARVAIWQKALISATVLLIAAGMYLLSLPIDPAVIARNAQEGFQFR